MFDPPNPRYKGKAFLRILEFYVLWVIAELPPEAKIFLEETTPIMRKTYGRGGDWQSIVEAEMEFPPDFPMLIRELWERNQKIARKAGVKLTPHRFAEMFVDENLL
jgi:hypothetical protein